MNFEQMMDALKRRLGTAPFDSFFTPQVCADLLNEALQALSVEADWPWLEASATLTSVPGTQSYAPTVQPGHLWMRTRGVSPTQDYDSLSLRSILEIREFNTVQGDPVVFTISGDQIVLAPTPNRIITYTHDYVRHEPTLVNNTDEPLLPIAYRFALLHLAAWMGHMRQNDEQRADMERRMYEAWLARMRDNRMRNSQFNRIRVRPGSML